VITGHNTDVEYAGRIYHVQTEDRGRQNPVIETLVYSRGEILDSRRTPYADSMKGSYDEKTVMRLLEQQHRRIIREVRNGRYDPEGPKPFGYNIISNRTLDEVVAEWLAADCGGEGLVIDLADAQTFFDKTEVTVSIQVRAAVEGGPIEGARVGVRLLDPKKKPAWVFESKTDASGSVEAIFVIPDLGGAGGALVFQVKHGDRAAELTRPVLPSS